MYSMLQTFVLFIYCLSLKVKARKKLLRNAWKNQDVHMANCALGLTVEKMTEGSTLLISGIHYLYKISMNNSIRPGL